MMLSMIVPPRVLPDIPDNQRVEDVAVAIEDVEPEGAAALGVLVNVIFDQFDTLDRIHDAEFVHYIKRNTQSDSFARCPSAADGRILSNSRSMAHSLHALKPRCGRRPPRPAYEIHCLWP